METPMDSDAFAGGESGTVSAWGSSPVTKRWQRIGAAHEAAMAPVRAANVAQAGEAWSPREGQAQAGRK